MLLNFTVSYKSTSYWTQTTKNNIFQMRQKHVLNRFAVLSVVGSLLWAFSEHDPCSGNSVKAIRHPVNTVKIIIVEQVGKVWQTPEAGSAVTNLSCRIIIILWFPRRRFPFNRLVTMVTVMGMI
jgi:hypothetical protein